MVLPKSWSESSSWASPVPIFDLNLFGEKLRNPEPVSEPDFSGLATGFSETDNFFDSFLKSSESTLNDENFLDLVTLATLSTSTLPTLTFATNNPESSSVASDLGLNFGVVRSVGDEDTIVSRVLGSNPCRNISVLFFFLNRIKAEKFWAYKASVKGSHIFNPAHQI